MTFKTLMTMIENLKYQIHQNAQNIHFWWFRNNSIIVDRISHFKTIIQFIIAQT